MSLFQYFEWINNGNFCQQTNSVVSKHASSASLGISEKEATKVVEELNNIDTQAGKILCKQTRVQYAEKDKIRISRYTIFHANRRAATHFAEEFRKLDESCVRRRAAE